VPLALLAGVVTGVTTARPERRAWRLGAAMVIDGLALSRIRSGEAVPTELSEVVQPASGCLTSDDPSNLVAIGVVGRNVTRECRLVVDLGGYSHDLSPGATVRRGPQRRLAAGGPAVSRQW
jgi:hypothetical protein